jgi:TetR/AcrR family transcriptional regulator, cholesterol catabolism regulator
MATVKSQAVRTEKLRPEEATVSEGRVAEASSGTKERILKIAAELFYQNGFAATSVREIAEAAGVGQSSLYHHLRSKDQILVQLHVAFIHKLLADLQSPAASDAPPADQLHEIARVILATVESHQYEVTVFLREEHALPEEARVSIVAERDKVDAIIDSILQRGINRGDFRSDIHVRLVRLAILGMCNWTYQWFRPNGSVSSTEIAEQFSDLCIKGLRVT